LHPAARGDGDRGIGDDQSGTGFGRREDSVPVAKTNALRIVASLGIEVGTLSYEVDENHLDAVSVAGKLGMDAERVFKTLALRGAASGIFLCCIPGNTEIDLRKAARASGNKNVELLPLRELLPATGYMRGGCSPVGAKRKFPVYIDETAQLFEKIAVSAGLRGLQMTMAPGDLCIAADAEYADLI
jgi:Cys-tRNA(Pro)/Cys-tRNA(Cys) deacylase